MTEEITTEETIAAETVTEETISEETTAEEPKTSAPEIARQRVRLFYERGEALKFISHQDEFRMWERTLRRADLPLLYKQGFNPHPHMQFAAPLGVGFTGSNEPLDITLSPPVPLAELADRIRAKLPPGVTLHQWHEVPLKTDSLSKSLIGADYTITIYAEPNEIAAGWIEAQIDHFLRQAEVWSERQRKGEYYVYNLRALIFELRYGGYDAIAEEHTLFLRVQQREGATGRPDEVVQALGCDNFARTLRRTRLYYDHLAEDIALFANYPVVSQQELSPSHAPKASRRKRFVSSPEKTSDGRAISERAADEFV